MDAKIRIARELQRAFEKRSDDADPPTKRSLAKFTKVSESQLGRFLTGEREPTAQQFISLTKALKMNPAIFWARPGDNEQGESSLMELVLILSDMDKDKRDEVVKFLIGMVKTLTKDQ